MSQQPIPEKSEKSQPVAESLKQRFAEFIDQRTALGVRKYGQALHTHNGRNAGLDMFEELVDLVQYQEQDRLEAWDKVGDMAVFLERILDWCDGGWIEPGDPLDIEGRAMIAKVRGKGEEHES